MRNVNEEAVSLLREDEDESTCAYIEDCRMCMYGVGKHYILYYFSPASPLSLSPLSVTSLKGDPGTNTA